MNMTKTDIACLHEDLEWKGTLGRMLLGGFGRFDISSAFVFPEEVAARSLDFRYGHGLQGGRGYLLQFVGSWLSRWYDGFCICHDMDARRGDEGLIRLRRELGQCRILFCSDEVYYCAHANFKPSCDELDLLLRVGSFAPMLMCMGRDRQNLLGGSCEELSAECVRRMALCCDYLVRGICDGEAFAVIPVRG